MLNGQGVLCFGRQLLHLDLEDSDREILMAVCALWSEGRIVNGGEKGDKTVVWDNCVKTWIH